MSYWQNLGIVLVILSHISNFGIGHKYWNWAIFQNW